MLHLYLQYVFLDTHMDIYMYLHEHDLSLHLTAGHAPNRLLQVKRHCNDGTFAFMGLAL